MSDDTPGERSTPLSGAELATIYHAVDEAIFVHDAAGRVVDANEAAAEMYGYDRAQLRDDSVSPISSGVPPYTEANASERIEQAAAGDPQTFEWQARDSDGDVFWVEVSLSRAVVDDEVRVLAIVRDIDDRKRAQRRFQTLIDNLPGVVYRCRDEPGWPMLFVGGQSEALTGYTAEQIRSGDVSWGEDVVHPDERTRVRRVVEDALADDEPFELTYRVRTADDEVRWMWERGRQVDVARRSATILEGFITDVTERKQYERQLEAQRDDLKLLNQVVRHDIRNDMTVVRGRAKRLENHVDEAGREDLEAVQEATESAIGLTKTARDLSETMLSTAADVGTVSLDHNLRAPVENARSKFDGAVITVEGRPPEVEVRGDELLEAVFRNLVENAIVHNDEPTPEVHISTSVDQETATVTVADNGPGIPDDQKETIFGRGEKGLDSPGAGIGLYLVRTLVERYGGDVRVEDGDPEGAVFVVELPVAG
jgi:PAS domain S-box-containing protein